LVGCLVGFDNYNRERKQQNKNILELHATVMSAQNAVQDGDNETALELYRRARIEVENTKLSTKSVHNTVLLNIVDQLGHLAYQLEHWEEADTYLNQAASVMLTTGVQKEDDKYLEVLLRLAVVDTRLQRKQQALERFNICITLLHKKIEDENIHTQGYSQRLELYGMALTEYAGYLKQLGELQASAEMFTKALNICTSLLGPQHQQTSVLYNDIATVYEELGRFDEALQLVEKAINIAGASDALQFLHTYKHNLAHILIHKGEEDEGYRILQELTNRTNVLNEEDR